MRMKQKILIKFTDGDDEFAARDLQPYGCKSKVEARRPFLSLSLLLF